MHKPTPEQEAIIAFARDDKRNLLVNALAGAAKTSTLVMLAHAIPPVPVLSLAFNKKIAEEMQKRMPPHVQAMTLNSLGHRAWMKAIPHRVNLNTSKTYDLVKEEMDALDKRQADLKSEWSAVMKSVSMCKANGYIPPSFHSVAEGLWDNGLYNLVANLFDSEPKEEHFDMIDRIMDKSISQAYKGMIDFDDQIYMPTLFPASFPKYPLILGDEAQDMSSLNHKMLEKLNGDRLIAVGDPWQSIYAFRGAHRFSMPQMKEKFNMEELTLSISFRCPIQGVKRAHKRVPHMKWREGANEGTIKELEKWSAEDVPDNAVILCRANAPLFSCALNLLKAGRGVQLLGRELGPALIKLLKKMGPGDLPADRLHVAIDAWQAEEIAKSREARHATIYDRGECLHVFAEFGKNLDEAVAYAEHLFSVDGRIKLMTGHKAKGLEFDTVFHLDPWRIPSKFAKAAAEAGNTGPLDQELNLEYVINTRWKENLYLVNLEQMR